MTKIKLTNGIITNFSKPYFIADIGANHDGYLRRAFKLIELAKKSGANAVKFQNFKAPKIVSKLGFAKLGAKLSHQSKWKKSVYETYEDASISDDWNCLLRDKCKENNIEYLTSPYDFESVDKVDKFLKIYKIGSGEITWHEIINYIAKKNKPVIIATGASNIKEVKKAIKILKKNKIVLMQCNTNYTANYENFKYINLNVLKQFKKLFPKTILGLSDHTFGHSTVLGAIALGATVFEKHFTDDNTRLGPDHKFAMNPTTWSEMIKASNELFHALGDGLKKIEKNELDSYLVQRRCLRLVNNLSKGSKLKKTDLIALRPAPKDSIEPYRIKQILGKRINKNLTKGIHIKLRDLN